MSLSTSTIWWRSARSDEILGEFRYVEILIPAVLGNNLRVGRSRPYWLHCSSFLFTAARICSRASVRSTPDMSNWS